MASKQIFYIYKEIYYITVQWHEFTIINTILNVNLFFITTAHNLIIMLIVIIVIVVLQVKQVSIICFPLILV